MKVALFLVVALALTFGVMALLGGWLLPRLGIEGTAATLVAGGVCGVLLAALYARTFRRPD